MEARDRSNSAASRRRCGFFESTKVCLDELYDNVVSGGFIIIDDYVYLSGCKRAVDEFLDRQGLSSCVEIIDRGNAVFQKCVTTGPA